MATTSNLDAALHALGQAVRQFSAREIVLRYLPAAEQRGAGSPRRRSPTSLWRVG
jgi:hypothetical protein